MRGVELNPSVLRSAPSVRLAGMGDVGLCVADEANELNTHDFGMNVAGVLEDSDRWVVESWMGGTTVVADCLGSSSERRYGNAGSQAVYRSENWALGVDINWTYFEYDDKPGDWGRVRGPVIAGLLNKRFGWVTLGMCIGNESENEDCLSEDAFTVEHSQNRCLGQIGAEMKLGGWVIGGAWDFERGDVEGASEDPARFHRDEFSWVCPVDRYSASIIFPFGEKIEGGIRARIMNREGGETVNVSWSDTWPMNPSKSTYFDNVGTFCEEVTDAELSTRWRFRLGGGMVLGLAGGYWDYEREIQEGVNQKGSDRAGRCSSDGLSAGVGISRSFMTDRLLVAIQARGSQGDLEIVEEKIGTTGTTRDVRVSVGAEYFPATEFALRLGLQGGSRDRDIDAPLTLSLVSGITGGISWLPRGGTVQVHGALTYMRQERWNERAVDLEDTDDLSYLVGLRLLL